MSDSNPSTNQSTSTVQETPSSAPAVEPAVNPAQAVDPNSLFANQLQSIKTDDGRQKYADVQTALNSIPHAQSHISEQAERIKQLEAELEQRKGMEAVLEQLQSQQQPQVEQPSNVGIDATQIDQLLDQRLQQREIAQMQQANAQQVLDKLNEQYGDNAEQQFNAKAMELGMTPAQLSDLARQTPAAALAFFNTPAPAPANPTTSSINTNVLESAPKPAEDPMARFSGTTSPGIAAWRAAAVNTD